MNGFSAVLRFADSTGSNGDKVPNVPNFSSTQEKSVPSSVERTDKKNKTCNQTATNKGFRYNDVSSRSDSGDEFPSMAFLSNSPTVHAQEESLFANAFSRGGNFHYILQHVRTENPIHCDTAIAKANCILNAREVLTAAPSTSLGRLLSPVHGSRNISDAEVEMLHALKQERENIAVRCETQTVNDIFVESTSPSIVLPKSGIAPMGDTRTKQEKRVRFRSTVEVFLYVPDPKPIRPRGIMSAIRNFPSFISSNTSRPR